MGSGIAYRWQHIEIEVSTCPFLGHRARCKIAILYLGTTKNAELLAEFANLTVSPFPSLDSRTELSHH